MSSEPQTVTTNRHSSQCYPLHRCLHISLYAVLRNHIVAARGGLSPQRTKHLSNALQPIGLWSCGPFRRPFSAIRPHLQLPVPAPTRTSALPLHGHLSQGLDSTQLGVFYSSPLRFWDTALFPVSEYQDCKASGNDFHQENRPRLSPLAPPTSLSPQEHRRLTTPSPNERHDSALIKNGCKRRHRVTSQDRVMENCPLQKSQPVSPTVAQRYARIFRLTGAVGAVTIHNVGRTSPENQTSVSLGQRNWHHASNDPLLRVSKMRRNPWQRSTLAPSQSCLPPPTRIPNTAAK
jgi:hypothetical protein